MAPFPGRHCFAAWVPSNPKGGTLKRFTTQLEAIDAGDGLVVQVEPFRKHLRKSVFVGGSRC